MKIQDFLIFAENFCSLDGDEEQWNSLPQVISFFKDPSNICLSTIESLGGLIDSVLKKAILTKRITVLPGNNTNITYNEELMNFHEDSLQVLRSIVKKNQDEQIQIASLKSLFSLFSIQSKFNEKSKFPVKEFSMVLECIITSEANTSSLLKILEAHLIYQDVVASIWESLRRILTFSSLKPLKPNHVKNIIAIINLNKLKIEELTKTISGRTSKYNRKKVGLIVREVWERISSVELQPDLQQKLSLALIEHIMPIIDKPVTLTDYFVLNLNLGGPNALIALQGIFNLIQKYNINYPNVYSKLYSMFEPGIFDTPYKPRFYYLSDIFLTTLCIPEGMVAAFIKRFSRLCLVAPPEDIVILMAFITNLLIRHPSLKYLINSSGYQTVETDPYDYDEKDPTKSKACESSLWEVKLMQEHVLPSVSASAMIINNSIPSTEKDLSGILENNCDQIFARECKKRLRDEVPVNYEKPFSIRSSKKNCSFNLWSLT